MAIQFRRGTASAWNSNKSNIVAGEPVIATDTAEVYVGTGSGTYVGMAGLTDAEYLSIANMIATQYSTVTPYTVGDFVIYSNNVYECNANCSAGSWSTNSSKFTLLGAAS